MKKCKLLSIVLIYLLLPILGKAQINQDKIGAWYMYFFNTTFKESKWGVQGDIQYRNWNMGGDLEQLLLRGGVTYKPKSIPVKFTLGCANITSDSYGPDNSITRENRIYQEALAPVKVGNRFYTNHRFRFEQRFNNNPGLRTRYRYNLFLNVPLNKTEMDKGAVYLAFYNEIFLNGQNIGNNSSVVLFDRNRLYLAFGYMIKKNLQVQLGMMNQTTKSLSKNQLQLSLHQKI